MVAAVVAVVVSLVSIVLIVGVLRMFAQPSADADGPGPTRSVEDENLVFRCSVCGTEVRMTTAPLAEVDAPRHCRETMLQVTDG